MVDLNDHMILEPAAPERQVHLTPIEWQLLQALVRHPGRLVSQRQLLEEVWGPTYVDQTHYLRQYVKALRHKLEDDPTRPRHLITEPGMGYRFQPSGTTLEDPASSAREPAARCASSAPTCRCSARGRPT